MTNVASVPNLAISSVHCSAITTKVSFSGVMVGFGVLFCALSELIVLVYSSLLNYFITFKFKFSVSVVYFYTIHRTYTTVLRQYISYTQLEWSVILLQFLAVQQEKRYVIPTNGRKI